LSADGDKVDCLLSAFGIHVSADGAIVYVTAYFEGGGTNTCDGLADMTIQWNNPVGAFTVNLLKISTFLNSMLL
jgi:hypothetical protein